MIYVTVALFKNWTWV